MIEINDGSEEMLPYVKVEIEPGRWPFQYWFEVMVWDPDHEIEGVPAPCFGHAYKYDGGAFGLWRAWRKAKAACSDAWFDELDLMKRNGKA